MHLFNPNYHRDIVRALSDISKEIKRGGDGWTYDVAGTCAIAAGLIVQLRKRVAELEAAAKERGGVDD